MYDLNVYKELLEYLEQDERYSDEINSLVNNDFSHEETCFEYDGKMFDVADGWDDEIHRFSDDGMPKYWYWKLDPSDEYAIFVEGFYDSWAGSEIEGTFEIGKIGEIVKKYISFTPVK